MARMHATLLHSVNDIRVEGVERTSGRRRSSHPHYAEDDCGKANYFDLWPR